jgi:hypothetical protein
MPILLFPPESEHIRTYPHSNDFGPLPFSIGHFPPPIRPTPTLASKLKQLELCGLGFFHR